jgi:hypothetical protein
MTTPLSGLWPALAQPAGGPAAAVAGAAWRRLSELSAVAVSAYERERIADLMVAAEAVLLGLALPCTAKDEAARALAAALTTWRTARDLARLHADLATLLGRPVPPPELPSEPEAVLMAACASHLEEGLLPLLTHIRELAAGISGDYLGPAATAVTAVAELAAQVWEEDRSEGPEAAESAFGWLLDPVSSAHSCALMAGDAAPALREGDQRAATVANRWAYSRVRTDTLALLTARHVGKTQRLISGQPG